jgi:hypothetical protein
VVTITETDGICRIVCDGKTLLECPVAFAPQSTMGLIKEINALKDREGTAIHTRYHEAGTPLWAMLQEYLFWEYLQPFVKYRPIIEWMDAHPGEQIETSVHGLSVWRDLLDVSGTTASFRPPVMDGFRHALETAFLIVNAALVGMWVRLRGAKFLLWSLNCVWGDRWIDYRLKDVYAALWEKSVPFVEGFPFPGFKLVLRRFLGSRRMVFFAPNIQRILPSAVQTAEHVDYDFLAVAGMPQNLLRIVVRRFEVLVANARLHTRLFATLFRLAAITRVIGIDEHTSFAALICAARSLGIETTGLQHGVFHKYSIGWTTPGIPHESTAGYDRILVWGEFWRELLVELSTTYLPEHLRAAGFIRPSTVRLHRRSRPPAAGPFTILLPYEFLANPEEIAAYVRAFHARGFKILFKVRFDDTLDEQLRLLPRDCLELAPELTQELIDSVHVCAGTSTTMMYELYYLGIPAWFIETRHDSNIHMVDHGLAAKVTLDMLKSPDFDPWKLLIPPADPEYIFSAGGIPDNVVNLCAQPSTK